MYFLPPSPLSHLRAPPTQMDTLTSFFPSWAWVCFCWVWLIGPDGRRFCRRLEGIRLCRKGRYWKMGRRRWSFGKYTRVRIRALHNRGLEDRAWTSEEGKEGSAAIICNAEGPFKMIIKIPPSLPIRITGRVVGPRPNWMMLPVYPYPCCESSPFPPDLVPTYPSSTSSFHAHPKPSR